jgi:3-keto-disaccharide hydrolase
MVPEMFLAGVLALGGAATDSDGVLFEEDFEDGLSRWSIHGEGTARIQDSGEAPHGKVLVLVPDGNAYALIGGSEAWQGVRLEGEFLFPTDEDSDLGVVYNLRRREDRRDFGVVYIKGNESYLQANPHRDWNVSRTIYPEYRAPLAGDAAVRRGVWHRFAVEVVGRNCHFYVGDTPVPQMTFPLFELDSGALGLQPRSVGAEVWVDNVRVTSLDRLSYDGPPRPPVEHDPSSVARLWEVLGPLTRTDDEIARSPASPGLRWRSFETDARGAVVTGRVVDFQGSNTVAYFRTRVLRRADGPATLRISTADDLALWVNGRFAWFIPRESAAWFDFLRNASHPGQSIPLELLGGENELVFRARGGVYASGGFFARVVDPQPGRNLP